MALQALVNAAARAARSGARGESGSRCWRTWSWRRDARASVPRSSPAPSPRSGESNRAACCPKSRCGSSRRWCRAPTRLMLLRVAMALPGTIAGHRDLRPLGHHVPRSRLVRRTGIGLARARAPTGGALRRCGSSPTRATPASCRCSGQAVNDHDSEVVGAAVAILGRIPDMKAAEILINAIKNRQYSPSRIATYVDQFPIPIAHLLRPLLHHPDATVRYWGVMLLARHTPAPDLERDLAALTSDPAPLVRRAAVASLTRMNVAEGVKAATVLLADPVWYVRAHAARAVGRRRRPRARAARRAAAGRPRVVGADGREGRAAAHGLRGVVVARALSRSRRRVRAQRRRGGAAERRHPRQPDRARGRHDAAQRREDRDAPEDHRRPVARAWRRRSSTAWMRTAGRACAICCRPSGSSSRGWRDAARDRRLVRHLRRGVPPRRRTRSAARWRSCRTLIVAIASRRRARYRGHPDEVLASSRFTIPVSVILPIGAEQDVDRRRGASAGADLPGARGDRGHRLRTRGVPASMRERFDLKACEIFFRRSLQTPPVRALYRSACRRAAAGRRVRRATRRGDALNCGVNLARYRYVCCADHRARYAPGFAAREHAAGGRGPRRRRRGHDDDRRRRAERARRSRRPAGRCRQSAAAPVGAARAARPRRAHAPAARAGRAARLHVVAAGRRPRDRRLRARPRSRNRPT